MKPPTRAEIEDSRSLTKERNQLRADVLEVIRSGPWHTTTDNRYAGILGDGCIRHDPPVSDKDRWKTAGGPAYYCLSRNLKGVSVFDFRGFDESEYQQRCPSSNWDHFVPFQKKNGHAVWIEISEIELGLNYWNPQKVLEVWSAQNLHGHTVMPHIEGVVIGNISSSAFRRVMRVDEAGVSFIS